MESMEWKKVRCLRSDRFQSRVSRSSATCCLSGSHARPLSVMLSRTFSRFCRMMSTINNCDDAPPTSSTTGLPHHIASNLCTITNRTCRAQSVRSRSATRIMLTRLTASSSAVFSHPHKMASGSSTTGCPVPERLEKEGRDGTSFATRHAGHRTGPVHTYHTVERVARDQCTVRAAR